MTSSTTLAAQATPYELLGAEPGVRRLVHRFYELMDELPEAHQVRRLHPESLANSEKICLNTSAAGLAAPPCTPIKKATPACACATPPTQSPPVPKTSG
jgi:hemoglobin